ncbi:MAG: hypothetical protein KJO20_04700, partial [Eudoraea sp.]|nr:hypothetical protein [Eudoraea sp.]
TWPYRWLMIADKGLYRPNSTPQDLPQAANNKHIPELLIEEGQQALLFYFTKCDSRVFVI